MKKKKGEGRRRMLLEQIEDDDREIHQMEKLLKFKNRRNKEKFPLSIREMGLDYILDIIDSGPKKSQKGNDNSQEDSDGSEPSPPKASKKLSQKLDSENSDQQLTDQKETLSGDHSLTEANLEKKKIKNMKKRQRKRKHAAELKSDKIIDVDTKTKPEENLESKKAKRLKVITSASNLDIYGRPINSKKQRPNTASSDENEDDDQLTFSEEELSGIRRQLRRQLNRVSEAQMARVLGESEALFAANPRALVRQVFSQEVHRILQNSVGTGWLEMELAVYTSSLHVTLQHGQQQAHLAAHVAELCVNSLDKIMTSEVDSTELERDPGGRSLFLAYLYRFEVITCDLIFDLIFDFVKSSDLKFLKCARKMLKSVGIGLRKDNTTLFQSLVELVKDKQLDLDETDVDLVSEFEGIVATFNVKKSKDEDNLKADHLKKMMKTWVKGDSAAKNSRLPLRLQELREAPKKGRWWVIGSAYQPNLSKTDQTNQLSTEKSSDVQTKAVSSGVTLSAEEAKIQERISLMAGKLGLKTTSRRDIFRVLVTSESPEEAVYRLTKPSGSGGVTANNRVRDQETVQISFRALMAEKVYNTYYARVLTHLCQVHRKFKIMIRCAIWDVLSKETLSPRNKIKCGRCLAYLVINSPFPVTLLTKYDFTDRTSGNVAFLAAFFGEITKHNLVDIKSKMKPLVKYPSIVRDLRSFLTREVKIIASNSSSDTRQTAVLAELLQSLQTDNNLL